MSAWAKAWGSAWGNAWGARGDAVIVESIGNYAGFDQRARAARAGLVWTAQALPPRIGERPAPRVDVSAAGASAYLAWLASCRAPIALQIINRPALVREVIRPALVRTAPQLERSH